MIRQGRSSNHTTISGFNGGLNTSSDPFDVGLGQSPNMLNVTSGRRGSLKQRAGRTVINTALSELNGNSVHYFKPIDSEEKLVAHFGTRLYKMDGLDGTFDEIRSGLKDGISQMVTYTASESGTLKNFVVLASSQNDRLFKWDGVETEADPFNPAATTPIGRNIIVWQNRLWLSGIFGDENSFAYTDFESLDFPTSNVDRIIDGDSEGLKAWGILRSSLYAFKRNSIHKITFLGGTPLFSINQVSDNLGTISPKAVKNVTFRGEEYILYVGSDKSIYLFNGYGSQQVSEPVEDRNDISDFSLEDLNDVALQDSWSTDDTKNQRTYFYFGLGGDSKIGHRLTFDYSSDGAWYPDSNMGLRSGTTFQDSSGKRHQVALDTAGKAYFMDKGNSDDGTTIEAVWQSPNLSRTSSDTKKNYYVKFWVRGGSTDTITYQYRTEFSKTFTTATSKIDLSTNLQNNGSDDFLGTFTLGTDELGGLEVISSAFDFARVATNLDIKITSSNGLESWEIYKIELYGYTVGLGKGVLENVT